MTEIADYIDDFEFLGDWDSRYAYLVELGEKLAPMPDEFKDDAHQVKGCMSTVHVAAVPDAENPGAIRFYGDCDTATIKGVIAILVELLSHKTLEQIKDANVDELFEGLKLHEHLSPNRHFGIYAVVELMKDQAAALSRAA